MPSLKSYVLAVGVAIAAASIPSNSALADAPNTRTSGGVVVARVGSREITAAELERRIASVPLFQLRGFGRTKEEIRRNFLDRVLVRELLLAEGASAKKLSERPEVQDRMRSLLRGMLLGAVRLDTAQTKPVTDAEARAYYQENSAKYHAPPRVAIWRIVVGSQEEAAGLIAEVKKDMSAKRWMDLAREKSLDKSNNMRGGNLGFVTPDGATSESEVKVSKEILSAVEKVKDGELVPEPVKEGERFAVLWRRQSMKEVQRTFEQEDISIRQILAHQKLDETLRSLLAKLQRENLSMYTPELVDQIDITMSGELQQQTRPGTLPASRRAGAVNPIPVQRPGGLR